MKTRFKVKENLSAEWTPKGSWKRVDPYLIVFCYGIDGENFIIKGGCLAVNLEIENIVKPTVVHRAYFHKGKSRGVVDVINTGDVKAYISKEMGMKIYKDGEILLYKPLKQVPRCFPKELKSILEV